MTLKLPQNQFFFTSIAVIWFKSLSSHQKYWCWLLTILVLSCLSYSQFSTKQSNIIKIIRQILSSLYLKLSKGFIMFSKKQINKQMNNTQILYFGLQSILGSGSHLPWPLPLTPFSPNEFGPSLLLAMQITSLGPIPTLLTLKFSSPKISF